MPGFILIDSQENCGFSDSINKGLMYSINEGATPENASDVIILNSDTVVTKGYVDKLCACAYLDAGTGMVTPLSNSATVASVPVGYVDNELPEYLSVDEMGDIVEQCSMKLYPQIPLGVGFCMFIKREVINAVGLFDGVTFEKGYGEENDFCCRAHILGYTDVLCDDTFIYHAGTASFIPEQKEALVAAHLKILYDRYPQQMRANEEFGANDPLKDIRENVAFHMAIDPKKKNILFVSHMDFREDISNKKGGVQEHVKDLVYYYKDKYNCFVAARRENDLFVSIYTGSDVQELSFDIGAPAGHEKLTDPVIAQAFSTVITAFNITLCHVHHITTLSFDIFNVCRQLSVPVVLSLHDYYYICPNVKLYSADTGYTGDGADIDAMWAAAKSVYPYVDLKAMQDIWTSRCKEILLGVDKLIAPSQYAAMVYERAYPEIAGKIEVIEHGIFEPAREMAYELKVEIKGNYHIHSSLDVCLDDKRYQNSIMGWAFIEEFKSMDTEVLVRIKIKGGGEILKVANTYLRPDIAQIYGDEYVHCGFRVTLGDTAIPAGDTFTVELMYNTPDGLIREATKKTLKMPDHHVNANTLRVGFVGGLTIEKGAITANSMIKDTVGENIRWFIIGGVGLKELAYTDYPNVSIIDTYDRESLNTILKELEIDVVCVLPQWGETYCYTVGESLACGIPVIATRIGAIADRVKYLDCVHTVSVDNAATEALDFIRTLASNPAKKTDFRSAPIPRQRTISAMCEDYNYGSYVGAGDDHMVRQTIEKASAVNECNEFSARYAFRLARACLNDHLVIDRDYIACYIFEAHKRAKLACHNDFYDNQVLRNKILDITGSKAYNTALKLRNIKHRILK